VSDLVFIVALKEEIENYDSILGHPVIFSGVGKINATIAACKAINMGFKKIINIGSCGSLKYESGKIISIGKVYQDIDLTPLCEYGQTLNEKNSDFIELSNSENSLISTDYFIDLSQIQKYSNSLIKMIHECSGFDMECYAIAKVCKINNIDFRSIKWISDNGNSSDWVESCKESFEKIKIFLENELEKERI
jgi:adenosylhomocysteine nucleosidase